MNTPKLPQILEIGGSIERPEVDPDREFIEFITRASTEQMTSYIDEEFPEEAEEMKAVLLSERSVVAPYLLLDRDSLLIMFTPLRDRVQNATEPDYFSMIRPGLNQVLRYPGEGSQGKGRAEGYKNALYAFYKGVVDQKIDFRSHCPAIFKPDGSYVTFTGYEVSSQTLEPIHILMVAYSVLRYDFATDIGLLEMDGPNIFHVLEDPVGYKRRGR
ncbi:hypothetical protein GW755_02800 [bacterium]|nr:hypothetical protein [bacterium]